MRRILVFMVVILWGMTTIHAQKQLSILPKAGTNVVNIEQATGLFKYENTSGGSYLNSWNLFNYGVTVEAMLKEKGQMSYGGEITFNRLYYWEEAYQTYYGTRYRWGDVSTVGLGFVAKYHPGKMFYLKPVISLEYFTDGSGITLGTAIAAGLDFRLSDRFTFPVELRTDQIFGNSVSLLIGLGFGLRMSI